MYDSSKSIAWELRLFGINRNLEQRCEQALADSYHPSEFLRLILEDERDARKAATAKRLAKNAKFRKPPELEQWDKSYKRGLTQVQFKHLTSLSFYRRMQNLLVIGKTGLGKTHLCAGLGKRLCDEGVSVGFYSVNLLFEEVASQKLAGKYLQLLKRISRQQVVIFDDFALRAYTHDEAQTLIEILEERAGNGIAMVTSQVDPAGWKSLFEDPVAGEAIIDRLLNPSEKVQLEGNSYREKLGKVDPQNLKL